MATMKSPTKTKTADVRSRRAQEHQKRAVRAGSQSTDACPQRQAESLQETIHRSNLAMHSLENRFSGESQLEEHAEDARQDFFCRVMSDDHRFWEMTEKEAASYGFVSIKNNLCGYLRKERKHAARRSQLDADLKQSEPFPLSEQLAVAEALCQLTFVDQLIVRMAYMGEKKMSIDAIRRELECRGYRLSNYHVRRRLDHSTAALQRLLKPE